MAWIESHQALGQHPKTRKLARKLGCSVPAAVGHLQFLWWWALDYAPDGNVTRFEEDDIADAVLWEGTGEVLVAALIDAGFLERSEDELVIHDWSQYAGRLIDARQFQTQRKQLHRDPDLVAAVRERDGDRCRYCGIAVNWKDRKGSTGGTYDHVQPRGDNSAGNIVVACRGCNSAKGKRTPDEAGMGLLTPPGRFSNPESGLPTQPTNPTNRTEPTEPCAPRNAGSETPVRPPRKSIVTEEWLQDERELFRERLPASGFWSFERVFTERTNQPYFKRAIDKRGYLHGQFENAAERWAEEKGKTNGHQLRTNPQPNNRLARTAPGPQRVPDMVVGD